MAIDAYLKVQKAAESPKQTEYRIFAQVTAALMKARDDNARGTELVEALDWNRRLWTTLANDCAMDDNQLSKELRAQIISLSIWTGRYSSDVALGKASIDALIDVNRAIMEGLAMQQELAEAEERQRAEQEAPGGDKPDVEANQSPEDTHPGGQ